MNLKITYDKFINIENQLIIILMDKYKKYYKANDIVKSVFTIS